MLRFLLFFLYLLFQVGCTDVAPNISILNSVSKASLSFENETIINDQRYIATQSPVVFLTVPAEASEVAVGEGSSCDGLSFQSVASSYTLALSAGDGTKSISFTYKIGSVTFSCQTVSVILASSNPTAISFSAQSDLSTGGVKYAASTTNALTISAFNATEMKISNDATCTAGTWEPYGTSKSWTLTSGDGAKDVSIQFKSSNGNTSSCLTDAVTLDTTAPDVSSIAAILDQSSTSNRSTTPNLSWNSSLDAGVGLDRYEVSLGTSGGASDTISWADVGISTTKSFSGLNLVGGTYYFNLRAIDKLGNTSAVTSVSYNIFMQNPSLTLKTPSASPNSISAITLTAGNTTAGDLVEIFSDSSCLTSIATATASATTTDVILSPLATDGTYSFYAKLSSGSAISACSGGVTYTLDTLPPSLTLSSPSLTLANASSIIEWTVTYSAADFVTLSASDITLNGAATAGCSVTIAGSGITSRTIRLTNCNSDGDLDISVASGTAHDLAGNGAPGISGSMPVTVDNTPPSVVISDLEPAIGKSNTVYTAKVTYSDATNVTLSASDLTLIGDGSTGCTKQVAGSGLTTRYVSIQGCTGNGSIGFLIAGGTASDSIGNLSLGASSTTASVNQVTYTIKLSSAQELLTEGNSNSTQNFIFNISPTPTVPVDIYYSVNKNFTTAINPTDTNITSGVITIPANASSIYTSYSFFGNLINEPSKTIQVNIAKTSLNINAKISGAISRKFIKDDDGGFIDQSKVAIGENHTCAISNGGVLKCWGRNDYGQLGDGTFTDKDAPVVIDPGVLYTDISTRLHHTCGITTSGDLKCWGKNDFGQLGVGDTMNYNSPQMVDYTFPSGIPYSKIAVGDYHTCGITAEATPSIRCWGKNSNGQLGFNNTTDYSVPQTVMSNSSITDLSSGTAHTCAIINSNAWCWGQNSYGQVGDNTVADKLTPTKVDISVFYSSISAGGAHTCAITNSGVLKCWGNNSNAQLGSGAGSNVLSPTLVSSVAGTSYQSVKSGNIHSCALTSSGVLQCWGANSDAQLGDGTTFGSTAPMAIDATTFYSKLAVGGYHSCAITASTNLVTNLLKCWGKNTYGQLGDVKPNSLLLPYTIDDATTYSQVVNGRSHSCGITTAGNLKCWGTNTYGQLGDGGNAIQTSPIPIDPGVRYAIVSISDYHTCGVTQSGILKCWGHNGAGQLGDGTNTTTILPKIIDFGTNYLSVSTGLYHTCAITSDHALKCWGDGANGKLGNGGTISSNVPAVIDSGTSYLQVVTGNGHTCGLTTGGVIKCWGLNNYGQLGVGDTTTRTSPTVVSGSNWVKIASRYDHVCAINSSNTLSCWGMNLYGQIGDGSTNVTTSPKALILSAIAVDTGGKHTCAIAPTGERKCWGLNYNGQFGSGDTNSNAAPSVFEPGQSHLQISTGYYSSCAITSSNFLKCWGENSLGQLGNGRLLVPTPVNFTP